MCALKARMYGPRQREWDESIFMCHLCVTINTCLTLVTYKAKRDLFSLRFLEIQVQDQVGSLVWASGEAAHNVRSVSKGASAGTRGHILSQNTERLKTWASTIHMEGMSPEGPKDLRRPQHLPSHHLGTESLFMECQETPPTFQVFCDTWGHSASFPTLALKGLEVLEVKGGILLGHTHMVLFNLKLRILPSRCKLLTLLSW